MRVAHKPIKRFYITIDGKRVSYLKRVPHGEPYLVFVAGDYVGYGMTYEERVANGWITTCRRYWDNVEMVPVD